MGFYVLPGSLPSEIEEYEKLVGLYLKGAANKVKFKAFRVPFGVYEQREPETYMCRIRLPGGAITPSQLAGIAELAGKYSDRPLHFTTRQEAQIHHVKLADTVNIIKELYPLGLATRGGGGNTVRNIIGEATAGIFDDEVFDVGPYIRALTSRFISEKDSWDLPRKLKIAFSGSPADRGLATVNDLGFIAKISDGKKGFKVYVAGGMGGSPQPGVLLYDFVPDTEVYNIAKAVKQLFDKHGNRKNRHAARLRFLFRDLGRAEFIKKFEDELVLVRKENYLPLKIEGTQPVKKGFLEIPLFLGDLAVDKAKLLGNILKGFGEDVLRTTTNQNLLVKNISPDDIPKLKKQLEKDGIIEKMPAIIGQAAVCAGASTCRLGICLSRGLLKAIKDRIEKDQISIEGGNSNSRLPEDFHLKISGCPNSCGQHLLADLGFFGVAKRFNDRMVPCYTVVFGVVIGDGVTKLAEKVGIVPARHVPALVSEFLQGARERARLEKLCEKYSSVPAFDEDKNFYFDWGANEVFSVAAKMEGECSAGVYDLIDWDFANIKQLQSQAPSQEVLRLLVVSASRALLVTKGLEPLSEADAVKLFKEHFVGKHLDMKYSAVIEKYLNNQELAADEVKELAKAVRGLYDAMDNTLKFPEMGGVGVVETQNFAFLQRDFRGVACPMNFVKTKLVLETMKPGEQLEILLDDGAPIENVPASVRGEGHKILEQTKVENYWRVRIEKR